MVNFYSFLFLVTVLILVPGPDYVIITKNTMAKGLVAGGQTLLGTVSALGCHTLFAVLGLSVIIVKSAALFTGLKYIGAVYLLYLGFKTLFAKTENKQKKEPISANPYFQGLFTNLFNPKVALFFLTFLPQFISTSNQSWMPFAFLGGCYIVLTAVIYSLYILLLNQVKNWLEKPKTQTLIQKISGVVLVLFGVKLLFEKI